MLYDCNFSYFWKNLGSLPVELIFEHNYIIGLRYVALRNFKSKKPKSECLLYENQLGNNSVIAIQNICVAKGPETVSYITAKRRFKRFRNGYFSLQADLRS